MTQEIEYLLTYKQWNEKGCKVHRGEQAQRVENGEAFFSSSQVYNPNAHELSDAHEEWLLRAQEWEDMPH